jgi:membrane associated rhomboid family serine protease
MQSVSALWLVGAYLILDLIGTLQQGQGVGYVAHLFGEIFGMAAGAAFVLSGFVTSTRYEENLLEMLGWKKPPRKKKRRRVEEDDED